VSYGYFDDAAQEYVITTPRTPSPWINYLGTEDFFSLVSNTAGGYSFYKDALLRRLTRYRYNNIPQDTGGRYFYLCDGDTVWNPGWRPTNTELDGFRCRHGLGYTVVEGEKNGLEARLTLFVPRGHSVEVQRLAVKNLSQAEKNIDLFSFIEFCLWNALDDMTNFQRNLSTGEVEVENGAIFHRTEYRERRNHYAYYAFAGTPDGFDTDRDQFLGAYGDLSDPLVVRTRAAANSMADGWFPIASHHLSFRLGAGEERELLFLLGYAENSQADKWDGNGRLNKEKARETVAYFSAPGAAQRALSELAAYWKETLGRFQVESWDPRFDRMVNTWNAYQCAVTFRLGRSASYFESGIGRGLGFRDTNQDLLGVVHQSPEEARQRILDVASTQLPDGSAYHQYQPLTRRGNDLIGGNFNDDPLWLVLATAAYVRETGDSGILSEAVPFDHNREQGAPLFEHLRRAVNHVLEHRGPHGLPLIGRADWNDCLNLNSFSTNPDEAFQTAGIINGKNAESVFIAGLFIYVAREYEWLARIFGGKAEWLRIRSAVREMEDTVVRHGWDGKWYLRAYADSGEPVGSHLNAEGQIYIETQGICGMAGVGAASGYSGKALESVAERLAGPYGIAILDPPYTSYHVALGEVSSYPPGYKENGGIFCHNNPWVMIAETMRGNGKRAFDYYTRIAPAYVEEESSLRRMEPYVYSQMVAGPASARHGEAKNSWLTGTAAWNYVAATQWILGIRPESDGLRVDPCIPPEVSGFTVSRIFRGSRYRITVTNTGVSRGVRRMRVDGERVEGNLIPDFADGKSHQVDVVLETSE